jgi:zinc/manganese transport system permease protein
MPSLLGHVVDPAMFSQPYMQNALLAGTIVAILAGLVGVFVVLRGVSFAAHSLAQMGFAGAAGAVLMGIDPLWGLVVFAVGGAVGLGVLGARDHGRDVTTALVLVAALGTGALFLTLNSAYATAAFSLLFGTIVGVSRAQVWQTGLLALGCLVALAALYRPLLLASVSPELAAARGVPLRLVSILFLIVVGVAAAITVPTVGTLLIFSLIVGPAGAAVHLAHRPLAVLLVSAGLGLVATWLGMVLAYDTGWPVGFFISAIVALLYLAARVIGPRSAPRSARGARTVSVEPTPPGGATGGRPAMSGG